MELQRLYEKTLTTKRRQHRLRTPTNCPRKPASQLPKAAVANTAISDRLIPMLLSPRWRGNGI